MIDIRTFWFYGLILCFITACVQVNSSLGQELISWQEYEKMTQEQNNLQLIDVRTPEEFEAGAIHSAVNIDFYAGDFETQLTKLDKTKPTVVYCKRGGRSKKAVVYCKKLGFENVYDIDGGYDKWQAINREQLKK